MGVHSDVEAQKDVRVVTQIGTMPLTIYQEIFHPHFKERERIIRTGVQTILINTKFPKRPTIPDLMSPAKSCKNKD